MVYNYAYIHPVNHTATQPLQKYLWLKIPIMNDLLEFIKTNLPWSQTSDEYILIITNTII